jgi:oligosaccharide repeat unit polymerase
MFDRRKFNVLSLSFLFVGASMLSIVVTQPEHPVFWLALVFWVVALILPFYLRDKRDPLEIWIPFAIYFFILFPLRAFYDAMRNEAKFFDLQSNFNILTTALVFGLLALLSFYLGYFQPYGKRLARRMPSLPHRFSSKNLVHISFIFLLIGSFSLFILARSVGFNFWSLYGSEEVFSFFKGKYYLLWGVDFLILLFVFLYGSRDPVLPTFVVTTFFILTILVGFYLGAKESILQPIFYWLVLRHYTRKRVSTKGFLAFGGAIVGLMFIYPFLQSYGPLGFKKFVEVARTGYLLKDLPNFLLSRFYGVESLALVLQHVPSSFPFKFGETFLELFIQPIPRFLWPDKPLSIGLQFTQIFTRTQYSSYTSSALSLPGEFYMNFGLPGILLGFVVLGIIARFIYEYLGVRRGASYAIIYALTLYAIIMLNEGNVSGRLPFYLTKLIPTVFAIFYLKPKEE